MFALFFRAPYKLTHFGNMGRNFKLVKEFTPTRELSPPTLHFHVLIIGSSLKSSMLLHDKTSSSIAREERENYSTTIHSGKSEKKNASTLTEFKLRRANK